LSVYELVTKRRTIRSFQQRPISRPLLEKLANAARLAPSGANLQPLEFIIVDDPVILKKVFATLRWAAYIAPAGNPAEDKQPMAYIIVLINTEIKKEKGEVDAAAAIENMILVALEHGVGSCWLGSINRSEIQKIFNIPEKFQIDSILALGYPAEAPVLEVLEHSVKYWKDDLGVLHVPKRNLADILHINQFQTK